MFKRLLLVACLTIASCGSSNEGESEEKQAGTQADKPQKITFTVKNKTGAKIIDVGINSSDSRMKPMSYGSIDKDRSETLKNDYLPSQIGLHWSKMNRDRTSKTIKVSDQFGSAYQGPIKLTIKPNGKVSVSK
ncbi:hypothetical protein JD969_07370 [Planctomycetota bacterium]|nr:hypothetical protein JD969_07370 [Planctomycetota bacterium]